MIHSEKPMKQSERLLTALRNFQVPIPAMDGTLERAFFYKATVEVKLSGKNTEGTGPLFACLVPSFLSEKLFKTKQRR